ncbi:MAG: HEPN domain-containing protein [Chlamydiales bacterium]
MVNLSMQRDEKQYVRDWLRIAEKDFVRTQKLLVECDPELAGFCLQQAVEKFLKAYLLSKGWKLRRTHHLDALLDDALAYDETLQEFRMVCIRITSFYFLERYPSLDSKITEEEVQDSLQLIAPLIKTIKDATSSYF